MNSTTDFEKLFCKCNDIMKKVITYGTYDLLHQGHLNLLYKAKELGDYLIVGVTTDSFDQERGKMNVKNNVLERVEAVKATGLADKIIIEEYVGQKIDDVCRYGVDIFAIGSDWEGKFDYLKEYCEVIYLPRTEGISSTMLRNAAEVVYKLGIIGTGRIAEKFVPESLHVEALRITSVYNPEDNVGATEFVDRFKIPNLAYSLDEFYKQVDAVYIASPHLTHYEYIAQSLDNGKHVLCETPMVLRGEAADYLFNKASCRGLVLMEANKTAHCPGFNHLVTLVKSGVIGDVVDIEASVSRLTSGKVRELDTNQAGGAVNELMYAPMLPIVKLLGKEIKNISFYTKKKNNVDLYTKGIVQYEKAIASFKLGLGVKTDGNLIISGTKGYIHVPSPWWKTGYFELCFEDLNNNKKYFYAYENDGLRYEIREFLSCINSGKIESYRLDSKETTLICGAIEQYAKNVNVIEI